MTYPPSSGPPDPYQPQQPYGQGPDPSTPYPQNPYAAPASGQPDPYSPPTNVPPDAGPPDAGQPAMYSPDPYGANPYGAAQPYPAYGGPQTRTNGLAIASLACSLGGLITCISAPVGIVLGHVAKRQIRQTGEQGEGLATAGLWIGYILTVLGILLVLGWLAFIIYFATTSGSTS